MSIRTVLAEAIDPARERHQLVRKLDQLGIPPELQIELLRAATLLAIYGASEELIHVFGRIVAQGRLTAEHIALLGRAGIVTESGAVRPPERPADPESTQTQEN